VSKVTLYMVKNKLKEHAHKRAEEVHVLYLPAGCMQLMQLVQLGWGS